MRTPCAMQGHMGVALRNRVKLKALWEGVGFIVTEGWGTPQFPREKLNNLISCQGGETR